MKHIVEKSDGNGITDKEEMGASASQTGPSQAEPVVSAVPASVPCAVYTHHHYGWLKHDLPNSHQDHLMTALIGTHGFLSEYENQYRVEVNRTPARSYDGYVLVYWDSDRPKTFAYGRALRRGDIWFKAFEFNVAPRDACRFCGGTGMDHYIGPFFHCWACDGSAVQVRKSTFRGFKHKPTHHAAPKTHDEYEAYLAAQAIEARQGGNEVPSPDESAVPKECAQPSGPSGDQQ